MSTGPGQLWHETVTSAGEALEERCGLVDYRGSSRDELDWFKPVWHPYLGTGLGWGQQRAGNWLQFNAPGWGNWGPDHTGFGDVWNEDSGMSQTTSVYLDGELADQGPSSAAYMRTRRPTSTPTSSSPTPRWTRHAGRSRRGHAELTFRSAATPDDRWTFLPLINLSFDVDTDLAGKVRAGKKLPIGLGAGYVAGAPDTGTIGGGKLEVSYDAGKTWRQVALRGGDGKASWQGTLNVPRDAEHVSLRASARDERGGSVTQEIVRAVAVR
ncbi:S8 family serine peptidase [Streptomyces violaceorubidus]